MGGLLGKGFVVAAWLTLAVGTAPQEGRQVVLAGARVRITVDSAGAARVEAVYLLGRGQGDVQEAGRRPGRGDTQDTVAGAVEDAGVPLRALSFEGRTVTEFVVKRSAGAETEPAMQGAGPPVTFTSGPGDALRAFVAAPREGRLQVAYTIPGALRREEERGRLVVPLVLPDLPPGESTPDFFTGEIALPPGWRIREGFPTALASGGGGRFSLPVPPAVLTLRLTRDRGGWFRLPALPLLLDLAALAGLVLFARVGARLMREGR
ncbi:MAG: hypothetical protein ACE5GJ_06650 [Gemmatimonadota bacterium]